jgi:branched-chain amino acid transport system ATP-binding protein
MNFLSVNDLTVKFGGIIALHEASLKVNEGEIYGIIGPNGAGKSTLLNCISRIYDPVQGEIYFKGKNITHTKAHRIPELGISRTFQNIELFEDLDMVDNILLGRSRYLSNNIFLSSLFSKSIRKKELANRKYVEKIIDFLELEAYRGMKVKNLPYGARKLIDLGRALAVDPEIILMDEPATGMNLEEIEDLAFWIRDILDEFGTTVVLVEHNMNIIVELCDRVVALNFGSVIAEGSPAEITSNHLVIESYLGEEA